jgi:hypothetical protein
MASAQTHEENGRSHATFRLAALLEGEMAWVVRKKLAFIPLPQTTDQPETPIEPL